MSNAGPLFRPYDKLVKITLGEKQFEVPDGNMLLRALQFLSPEDVSYGKFCWNEECQYCRVSYDLGPDTPNRTAISCKLMVQEGMRITEVAQEMKILLAEAGLELKVKAPAEVISGLQPRNPKHNQNTPDKEEIKIKTFGVVNW